MSWVCPNQDKGQCQKLDKLCVPMQEGCVLEKKVQMLQPAALDRESELHEVMVSYFGSDQKRIYSLVGKCARSNFYMGNNRRSSC